MWAAGRCRKRKFFCLSFIGYALDSPRALGRAAETRALLRGLIFKTELRAGANLGPSGP